MMINILKLRLPLLAILLSVLLSSCNDDLSDNRDLSTPDTNTIVDNTKDPDVKVQYLTEFASILSKAVYNDVEVRKFLKENALQRFDENYDVLYYLVKDSPINGKSFRDILVGYSSEEKISEIEKNVPLLNILIPEISFFNVKPENLDINDKETPVAVSRTNNVSLFLNGKEALSLNKGEVPNFNVFVVNQNSRVVIPTREEMMSSRSNKKIQFKSPNFDRAGKLSKKLAMRFSNISKGVSRKAIDAFYIFDRDDNSDHQIGLQRDYIYYGITPTNHSGPMNNAVSEYISYLEVNPKVYFKIADVNNSHSSNDPHLKTGSTSNYKRELSQEELISRFWTQGAYDFKFSIISSNSSTPKVIYIPLRPQDLWDFHIPAPAYRHPTFFRHSKYTYYISPNDFTSKRIYLDPEDISLGRWDLSRESLYRYIMIEEEDPSAEVTYKETFKMTKVKSSTFNGNAKVEIGIGKANVSGGVDISKSNSNTIENSNEVTIRTHEGSDQLGTAEIYFYDPIIIDAFYAPYTGTSDIDFTLKSYNTGSVNFAISVR